MKDIRENVKKLWPYYKDQKARMIITVILNLIQVVCSVVAPIIEAQIIINLTSNVMERFILMSVGLALIFILEDVLMYFVQKIFFNINLDVSFKLQQDLAKEVLKLDNKTLDTNNSGTFIQRLVNDSNTLSTSFEKISSYIRGILGNIGVFISLLIINKLIFAFVIVIVTIRFIIEKVRLTVRKKNMKLRNEENDKVTGFTGEMIRGAKDIKMLNSEESFLVEFKNKYNKYREVRKKGYNSEMIIAFIRWIWSELSYLLLLMLIAILVINNRLDVTLALVVYNYKSRWNSFVSYVTSILDVINDFDVTSGRIVELLNGKDYGKESFGNKHLNKVNGDFEFKNVSFSYKRKKVLKDLSFKVNANETVAFVGKSGAGKTTIFSLLCKMYDNYKGEITIDGHNIKNLDKDSIRGNITIVSQNPYIFNMSIKDNLKLVCNDLTNKQMKEACRMACLDKFIESLPDKYDTIVGEGGVTLSGGQKQRLAIARAFVQKTEIILFDEATSALDNETQRGIAKAINNLQKDYTILIIAHRLSTIKNADRILFIDDGKVIAEGSHEKLLKTCKEYKDLYEAEIEK